MTDANDDERKRLIRRIHAEARSIGLDDADRKALQARAVGKESCADMSTSELRRVIEEMGRSRDRLPDTLAAAKLRALWLSAWHLGVVRDPRDSALGAWVRRQTGLDAAAWAKPAGMARAIQALQAWLSREAGVDWRPYVELRRDGRDREVERPRCRVLEAQWRILHSRGIVMNGSLSALGSYATAHGRLPHVGSYIELDDMQADALIRDLGAKIREVQRG